MNPPVAATSAAIGGLGRVMSSHGIGKKMTVPGVRRDGSDALSESIPYVTCWYKGEANLPEGSEGSVHCTQLPYLHCPPPC